MTDGCLNEVLEGSSEDRRTSERKAGTYGGVEIFTDRSE